VDEVQHDQVQISWELPSHAVRCASYTAWTRPSWRDPAYAEVEAISQQSSSASDAGTERMQMSVLELEPERQYVIEVRAHSSRGAGEWCRTGDQPICTAIVAPPPLAPELVYATPRALTFSFAGVEDPRVTSYEVRRYEGWAGSWGRASRPLKFDAQSLAVRVTSEKRWVVNMDQLRSETAYTLQLRGVTEAVTQWSPRSEAMFTLEGNGDQEDLDEGVGVNDGSPVSLLKPAVAGAPALGSFPVVDNPESVEEFSKKLEAVLFFTMDYATAGVRLPSVRIPSVAEQADELLRLHQASHAAAIATAAKIEDDASWRTKLPDFLIQQVPVVGCSTLLLRELWRNIRRCALIAHLYGHDTSTPEVQALILTCLMPTGTPPSSSATGATVSASSSSSAAAAAAANPMGSVGVEDVVNSSRKVALLVSRALAKETLVRATGLRSAGQVVGLLELAGRMLRGGGLSDGPAGQGDMPPSGSSGSGKNARAAVEDFAGSSSSSAAEAEMGEMASPARVALVVFRPQNVEERPVIVLGFLALWLLPMFVSLARFTAARLLPLLARRVQMELPLAGVVGLLIVMQVIGIAAAIWVQQNMTHFVSIPATLVFVLYAAIPGGSIYLATRSVLQGAEEAPFFALLGVYNLASGYLRWADDVNDDAALEQRPAPRISGGRRRVTALRRGLWLLLLADFVVEEILGRVCGLHSARLLGPPPRAEAGSAATVVEYRTVSFLLGLLSAWSQARVLALLQRRTVLLRLLGARKAIFGGLTLLLMGAFAVVQQNRTVGFLREVSPTPWWCCMVLWIRQFGAVVGAVLPLVFHILLQPRYLGQLSLDGLVPMSVAVGAVLGNVLCSSFHALWFEKREHLESDYRVLHLFPHMSSQARSKASVAMRLAFKRGAEATTHTAVEWAASRTVRTVSNWLARRLIVGGY